MLCACCKHYGAIDDEAIWAWVQDALKDLPLPQPEIGILSGSGLAIDLDEVLWSAAYADIAGFPVSSVAGHPGRLQLGLLEITADGGQRRRTCALNFQGRLHFYEGWPMATVALPVRLMARIGTLRLAVLTSAVGSLWPERLPPGTLCVVGDHVSVPAMAGLSPLIGAPVFVPMSHAYSLREPTAELAALFPSLRFGIVYVGLGGPQYETSAEVRLLQSAGDVVGMSTTPEVVQAAALRLPVLAVALVCNVAGGPTLAHAEVLAASAQQHNELQSTVRGLAGYLLEHPEQAAPRSEEPV